MSIWSSNTGFFFVWCNVLPGGYSWSVPKNGIPGGFSHAHKRAPALCSLLWISYFFFNNVSCVQSALLSEDILSAETEWRFCCVFPSLPLETVTSQGVRNVAHRRALLTSRKEEEKTRWIERPSGKLLLFCLAFYVAFYIYTYALWHWLLDHLINSLWFLTTGIIICKHVPFVVCRKG